MNNRAVAYQLVVFLIQWGLMILGFGILSKLIAPIDFFETEVPLGNYVDAAVKALVALGFSVAWLFIWDRQVRSYFYRRAQ